MSFAAAWVGLMFRLRVGLVIHFWLSSEEIIWTYWLCVVLCRRKDSRDEHVEMCNLGEGGKDGCFD